MKKELLPRCRGGPRRSLQDLCQFVRKGAAGRLISLPAAALPAFRRTLLRGANGIGRHGWLRSSCGGVLPFRGLRRIGPQQPVFQRSAIEAANDGLHLVVGRRFDKCEALGFLGFVVSDHFYGIGHEIFGGQPLPDVIGGDPGGKITKKYGKAHSVDYFTPLVGLAALQREDSDLPTKWYQVPDWIATAMRCALPGGRSSPGPCCGKPESSMRAARGTTGVT